MPASAHDALVASATASTLMQLVGATIPWGSFLMVSMCAALAEVGNMLYRAGQRRYVSQEKNAQVHFVFNFCS